MADLNVAIKNISREIERIGGTLEVGNDGNPEYIKILASRDQDLVDLAGDFMAIPVYVHIGDKDCQAFVLKNGSLLCPGNAMEQNLLQFLIDEIGEIYDMDIAQEASRAGKSFNFRGNVIARLKIEDIRALATEIERKIKESGRVSESIAESKLINMITEEVRKAINEIGDTKKGQRMLGMVRGRAIARSGVGVYRQPAEKDRKKYQRTANDAFHKSFEGLDSFEDPETRFLMDREFDEGSIEGHERERLKLDKDQ